MFAEAMGAHGSLRPAGTLPAPFPAGQSPRALGSKFLGQRALCFPLKPWKVPENSGMCVWKVSANRGGPQI